MKGLYVGRLILLFGSCSGAELSFYQIQYKNKRKYASMNQGRHIQGKEKHNFLSFRMAAVSHEIPRSWFEGKVGVEFTLPNISSPWLMKVFQLWNDNFNAPEASHRSAEFQTGQDMQVILAELADSDSEFVKKGVALIPIVDFSPVQPHPQSSSEQRGICSSSVDSFMWDETEVVTSCNSTQGHLIDYGRGINLEVYGQREVGTRM